MKLGRAIPTPIRIMPTDSHGFIIDVGFATFACEGPESALRVLGDYLKRPKELIDEIEAVRGKGKSGDKNTTQFVMAPCPDGIKLKSP